MIKNVKIFIIVFLAAFIASVGFSLIGSALGAHGFIKSTELVRLAAPYSKAVFLALFLVITFSAIPLLPAAVIRLFAKMLPVVERLRWPWLINLLVWPFKYQTWLRCVHFILRNEYKIVTVYSYVVWTVFFWSIYSVSKNFPIFIKS